MDVEQLDLVLSVNLALSYSVLRHLHHLYFHTCIIAVQELSRLGLQQVSSQRMSIEDLHHSLTCNFANKCSILLKCFHTVKQAECIVSLTTGHTAPIITLLKTCETFNLTSITTLVCSRTQESFDSEHQVVTINRKVYLQQQTYCNSSYDNLK